MTQHATLPLPVLAKALLKKSSSVVDSYKGKEILRSLRYHGITELSYKQFENKPKLHNALEALSKESIAVEMSRSVEIEKLLKNLHALSIDFLVFKGTALAYFLYRNAWQRPRSDTDILINKNDLDKILELFYELGYEQSISISGKFVSYQTTVTKQVSTQFVHRVDIHWKINNRQILANCYSLDELLERSKNCTLLNQEMFIPNNIDSLILACIHRIGHHADNERIIWLYDIHLLAESLSHEKWAMLIAKVRKKNVSQIVFDGISTSNALLDTKIDKSIYQALKKSLNTNEASAIFLDREQGHFKLFFNDLMFLPKWSQRLMLIKEHLVPDKEYLAAKSPSMPLSKAIFKRLIDRATKRKPKS